MSKQVQPALFDLHLKGVDSVVKADCRLGGNLVCASRHGYFTSLYLLGAKP